MPNKGIVGIPISVLSDSGTGTCAGHKKATNVIVFKAIVDDYCTRSFVDNAISTIGEGISTFSSPYYAVVGIGLQINTC